MNSTNRGLNRLFIVLVGLLLVVAGGVAVALGAVPAVAAAWRGTADSLASDAQLWVADAVVGRASLLVLAVALAALVLIVLLIAFIARQGRGRTGAALQQRAGSSSVRIDLAVAKALLEEHLDGRDELVALRIAAYDVRGTPMLKITARCRRGISPAVVADLIGRAIGDLERIVGADVPSFVQLTGGFRAGSLTRPSVS